MFWPTFRFFEDTTIQLESHLYRILMWSKIHFINLSILSETTIDRLNFQQKSHELTDRYFASCSHVISNPKQSLPLPRCYTTCRSNEQFMINAISYELPSFTTRSEPSRSSNNSPSSSRHPALRSHNVTVVTPSWRRLRSANRIQLHARRGRPTTLSTCRMREVEQRHGY